MKRNMRTGIISLGVAFFLMVMLVGSVSAADDLDNVYVSPAGNDTSGDGSEANPYQTLQKGIETVNGSGSGVVHLAAGTYKGTGNKNLDVFKNFTLQGAGKENTIIDAENTDNIIDTFDYSTIIIRDLTIRNGYEHGWGGAIGNTCNLTIINCNFENNQASLDGGAIVNLGIMEVRNCVFINNNAVRGGAISNGKLGLFPEEVGNLIVLNSTFSGNTAEYGAGIYNNGTLTISESTLLHNTATNEGGAIYTNSSSPVTVNYNRIFGNSPNAIRNNGGAVDAQYNWWGSNNPDFATLIFGVNVDYIPWLYMTITTNPTIISAGEASLITVSFNNLYGGTTVAPLDPAMGHIPDGTPVFFTTSLGNLGSKTKWAYTSGGIASVLLLGNEGPGIAYITAAVDQATLFTNVTIAAGETNVSGSVVMQPTGIPLIALIMAILMVFGGVLVPKRK